MHQAVLENLRDRIKQTIMHRLKQARGQKFKLYLAGVQVWGGVAGDVVEGQPRAHSDGCSGTLLRKSIFPRMELPFLESTAQQMQHPQLPRPSPAACQHGAKRKMKIASRVDKVVPGSRKGVVQKASMTGTFGSTWYVTTRRRVGLFASSLGSVSPALPNYKLCSR